MRTQNGTNIPTAPFTPNGSDLDPISFDLSRYIFKHDRISSHLSIGPTLSPTKSIAILQMKATTLLLLVQGDPITHVLLGFKKVGFGKGKYTGIGGKVEPDETIEAAAIREMTEEAGVFVEEKHLLSRGHIDFYFPTKPEWDLTIHIFLTKHWQGTPTESREIRPQWFDVQHLPFDNMWRDAPHWYLRVLQNEKIRATFTFKPDNETIETYQF